MINFNCANRNSTVGNLLKREPTMIILDFHNKAPIYEQIKEQVMCLIQKGVYVPGEQLPSIRLLAAELQLNVNTVKRAFQDLEVMGVTYSIPGKGIFVAKTALNNVKLKESALDEAKKAVMSAKSKGVSIEEVDELIKNIFNN